jgi:hypothetical protein
MWLARKPSTGVSCRDLIVTTGDRDDVFGFGFGKLQHEHAIGVCLTAADRLLIREYLHIASGLRFTAEAIRGKHHELAGRDLRDEAHVRHDDNRVGAKHASDCFDEVHAGLLDVQRNAPEFRIAVVGQQLAPGCNELIGVEERHLRKRRLIQHDALRDLLPIARGATLDAIVPADLIAKEAADFPTLTGLPVCQPFDPAALLGNGALLAAQLMRLT